MGVEHVMRITLRFKSLGSIEEMVPMKASVGFDLGIPIHLGTKMAVNWPTILLTNHRSCALIYSWSI